MINKGEIIEVYIDSLCYGGEGIGKYNGISIFVPDVTPGDKVKVEIISSKKTYAKGVLKEIIEPSEHRTQPACSLAKVCGGCQWQHIDYEKQLISKKKIVEETIKKIAGIDVPVLDIVSNNYTTEYRCKVQYPVQQTKVSKRVLAGYYKKGTHEVVNIKYCPVQPQIINEITQFLRDKFQELGLSAYNEAKKKGLIRHFVYKYSQTNKNLLLILVINSKNIPDNLKILAKQVKDKFKDIAGVLVNFNITHTNVILGRKYELLFGQDYIEENLEGKKFKISAGSFFQVNPSTATKMFDIVQDIATKLGEQNLSILDAYAGVGTFSIWLKDVAATITTIEENPYAIKDALENIKLNQTKNMAKIDVIEGDTDQVLQKLLENNEKFDITILDPPRKGCSEVTINSTASLTKQLVIYVSCNPATLARDIKLLNALGFIPEYVQPVDMFCHTYHIESIVVLKKQA